MAFLGEYGTTFVLLAFVLFMYIVAVKKVNLYSAEDWHAGFYTQTLSGDRNSDLF